MNGLSGYLMNKVLRQFPEPEIRRKICLSGYLMNKILRQIEVPKITAAPTFEWLPDE